MILLLAVCSASRACSHLQWQLHVSHETRRNKLELLMVPMQVLSTRARKDVKVEDITIQVQLRDGILQSMFVIPFRMASMTAAVPRGSSSI